MAEFVFIDAPHELPFIYQTPMCGLNANCASSLPPSPPPPLGIARRSLHDGPFDPLQYQQQTDGYDISLSHLKNVFSQEGPFDGILGFSQGAAMAALVSAQQEKLKGEMDFKFVVLCSGLRSG
ncbi:Rhodanese domain-containing protein 6 [Spatholobus suberectus]|nr:Rhodanese domain-containing protein 6 [Spatholobus suberectus]